VASSDVDLPSIITAVTPQKKTCGRWSVFVDDEFLIGVDESVLLKNGLRKGVEMTPALFSTLQREEGRQTIKNYLLKLLSRRAHARQELFTKASRKKDFSPEIVNDVLDELEEKDFIDDREFAQKFARDKNHLNDWGPVKIKAHLRQKGVDKHTAEEAVSNTFEEVDLDAQFRKLIKKRKKRFAREEHPLKRKKKVANYLQRKGYYASDVYQYLDSLMDLIAETEDNGIS
jgi:regulatory protein